MHSLKFANCEFFVEATMYNSYGLYLFLLSNVVNAKTIRYIGML